MAVKTVKPMKILKIGGKALSDLDEEFKEELSTYTLGSILALVSSQFEYRYDKAFFLYRFYLQLVGENWLNPSDKEIGEDLWTISLYT